MTDYAAKIASLVKPYAYTCDVRTIINLTPVSDRQNVEVHCWLKAHGEEHLAQGRAITPADVRQALFISAQYIIHLIEVEGFEHAAAPRIEINGDLTSPLGSEPKLLTQGHIDLDLLVKIDD